MRKYVWKHWIYWQDSFLLFKYQLPHAIFEHFLSVKDIISSICQISFKVPSTLETTDKLGWFLVRIKTFWTQTTKIEMEVSPLSQHNTSISWPSTILLSYDPAQFFYPLAQHNTSIPWPSTILLSLATAHYFYPLPQHNTSIPCPSTIHLSPNPAQHFYPLTKHNTSTPKPCKILLSHDPTQYFYPLTQHNTFFPDPALYFYLLTQYNICIPYN